MWMPTKREENWFLVSERKVLRTINGPEIVVGVYRSRYNLELDREFNSPNVIGVVKSNRLRYFGHMIKGAEDLPQRALFIRVGFFYNFVEIDLAWPLKSCDEM
jgi:hypothetical protein